MVNVPPRGIYVPVPTFFLPPTAPDYDPISPAVDVATQAAHALHLARSGIRGLVLLGSTGEAVHLADEERTRVIAHVRRALDRAGFPDYPLVAGTATQAVGEAVRQLVEARDAGAQWGLCLVPGYFAAAVGQAGILEWFVAVADRSPIPILIYHYPGVSNGVALPPSTIEQLAQHPNIVGCKLSHGNLDDHALVVLSPRIEHAHFRTFTGLGQQLLPVLTVGGAGAIDGLASIFPKTVVKLFDLFEEGEKEGLTAERLAAMRALQYKIAAGEKLVARWGTVGIKEATSRVRGFGQRDGARLPLKGGFPAGEAEWENWREAMDALEQVEQSLPEVR